MQRQIEGNQNQGHNNTIAAVDKVPMEATPLLTKADTFPLSPHFGTYRNRNT